MSQTVRLTMAQALVRFLENQYIEVDGVQTPFVRGVFIIPGHGNVVGLGQALIQEAHRLEVYQGKNEQGMAQAAVAFAKQMKRKQICVATSSIGPGAANMVTACGTATSNNIPLLVLPAASPIPCCSRWSTLTPWQPPPTTLSRQSAATGTGSSGPSSS